MLFSTPTEWVVMALLLVAGWLFGLASHPGGGKWKARYLAERDAHAGYRKDADVRAAEANAHLAERDRTHASATDERLAAANARIAELERDNSRLAASRPTAVPIGSGERVEIRPGVATSSARPAYATGERPGWFDWGKR